QLSESTVESYISNDVNTGYVPYDNGSKLVSSGIYYNGNVGIGTTSPARALDVNGTGRISSDFEVGASAAVYYMLSVGGFTMSSGASNGYVLTSDAGGTGTWQAASGVPSQAFVAFPDASARTGWTYTGCSEVKVTVADNTWATKASMPTARGLFGIAAVNGKIYAMGGSNAWGSYLATNEEYDPSTDSWTTKTSMPAARYALAAAVVNNKIYAIGGAGHLATNEEYDPSTNTWATKASMPTGRELLAAAAVNNKIYAIGGHDGHSLVSTNEEYDPSTDTWTTKTPMLTARDELAAAAVNNKIYAIGGYGGYTTNEEYDPSTDAWVTVPSMPTARAYLAAAVANGKIYAIGGDYISILSANEEYNPITEIWTVKVSMPTARSRLAAAVVGGKIYAIGGYDGSNYLSTNEEYTNGLAFYWFQKD
ncbi:hypothetical protein J7L68_06600, partial [bacterium]|nr:hypothetical protein [bacterium]